MLGKVLEILGSLELLGSLVRHEGLKVHDHIGDAGELFLNLPHFQLNPSDGYLDPFSVAIVQSGQFCSLF